MNIYYVDSSAWLKRYYQEPGSKWVRDLFLTDDLLSCSAVGLVEVYATLARKRKAGQINQASLGRFTQELELDWGRFAVIKFDDPVLREAKASAQRFALRGADAIHLASALVLRESLVTAEDQFVLISSDQELKSAALSSGLEIFDPAE